MTAAKVTRHQATAVRTISVSRYGRETCPLGRSWEVLSTLSCFWLSLSKVESNPSKQGVVHPDTSKLIKVGLPVETAAASPSQHDPRSQLHFVYTKVTCGGKRASLCPISLPTDKPISHLWYWETFASSCVTLPFTSPATSTLTMLSAVRRLPRC